MMNMIKHVGGLGSCNRRAEQLKCVSSAGFLQRLRMQCIAVPRLSISVGEAGHTQTKVHLGGKLTDHGHGEGRVDSIIILGGGGGGGGGGVGSVWGGGGEVELLNCWGGSFPCAPPLDETLTTQWCSS